MESSREKKAPMKVLSLGMSRTGTSSMKAALQILGHQNVHHAYELYSHPQQAQLWLAAWKAKAQPVSHPPFTASDWDSLLAPYSAVTDMPAVCFAPELIKIYPDAQVVLVKREVDSWYESFNKGVIETFWDNHRTTGILSMLDPELMKPVHELWENLFALKDGYFRAQTKEEMQANAKRVYEEHYDLILRTCPKERLLEFDLKDGWGPLCAFLGCDIPKVAFPRVNEGDEVKGIVGEYVKKSMRKVYRNVAVGVLVLGLGIQGLRMALS